MDMNNQKDVNPTAFGAIGFGFALFLLALYFADIIDTNGLGVVFATALFAGGFTPLLAGLWSLRTGNSFGATTFILGATFWFSYVFIYFLPILGLVPSVTEPAIFMLAQVPYLFLWGFFSFWLFLSSMKINRVLQIFFFLLAIFFWLVAFGHWFAWDTWHSSGTANTAINIIAGWEGIACGFVGIYYGIALILNEAFKRDLMPLGVIPQT
jgi:succinate-acetate transporter protein